MLINCLLIMTVNVLHAADWDEDAPLRIPDELATKPDDWSEDTPLLIADPEAEQPESK
jgi:Calreticulin family